MTNLDFFKELPSDVSEEVMKNIYDGNDSIKTISVNVTPELAKLLLSRNDINRSFRKNHIANVTHQMVNDNWKYTAEPIIIGENGILLDGQHRLQSIINSNKTLRLLIAFNVDSSTFDVIDSGRARNGADVLSCIKVTNYAITSAIIKKHYMFTKYNTLSSPGTGGGNIKIRNSQYTESYTMDEDKWDTITRLSCHYAVTVDNQRKATKIKDEKLDGKTILSKGQIGFIISLLFDLNINVFQIEAFFNTVCNADYGNLIKLIIAKQKSGERYNDRFIEILLANVWNHWIDAKSNKMTKADNNAKIKKDIKEWFSDDSEKENRISSTTPFPTLKIN